MPIVLSSKFTGQNTFFILLFENFPRRFLFLNITKEKSAILFVLPYDANGLIRRNWSPFCRRRINGSIFTRFLR